MTDPVYFDARYIRVGHHDGISRFSAALCAELSKLTEVIAIVSDDRQLAKLPKEISYVKLTSPTNPLTEFFIPQKLNALGAKLVFSPMQTMGSIGRKYRLILTLHDLIYYAHPTPPPSFAWPIRFGWRLFHMSYIPQRIMLNGADAVVTVSKTTKSLIEKHRLTKKPVFVVYNAASGVSQVTRGTPEKFLVYMGSYMDYKNVECLIEAMSFLPEYQLHLLSRISDARKTQLLEVNSSVNERVIFHNGVTDQEYHAILGKAFALVSASKDEGFGIPVVEAMELGTPAVISDIEIFREIGGDAASYFDSAKSQDLANCVRQLETDEIWQLASKRAKAQAAKFSWAKSAEALLKALNQI